MRVSQIEIDAELPDESRHKRGRGTFLGGPIWYKPVLLIAELWYGMAERQLEIRDVRRR